MFALWNPRTFSNLILVRRNGGCGAFSARARARAAKTPSPTGSSSASAPNSSSGKRAGCSSESGCDTLASVSRSRNHVKPGPHHRSGGGDRSFWTPVHLRHSGRSDAHVVRRTAHGGRLHRQKSKTTIGWLTSVKLQVSCELCSVASPVLPWCCGQDQHRASRGRPARALLLRDQRRHQTCGPRRPSNPRTGLEVAEASLLNIRSRSLRRSGPL
jgi:hypothetical protein